MAVTRRTFLKRTLAGGVAAAGAGGVALALRPGAPGPPPRTPLRFFTPAEYGLFAIVARRVVPPVAGAPSADELDVAGKADGLLARAAPHVQGDLRRLLGLFDDALAAFLLDGRTSPFSRLSAAGQDEALRQWRDSRLSLRRSGFQGLQRLAAALYYSDPRSWPAAGYPGPPVLVRADGSLVGGTAAQRAAARPPASAAPEKQP